MFLNSQRPRPMSPHPHPLPRQAGARDVPELYTHTRSGRASFLTQGLTEVTIRGYHVVMSRVRIAELKSRLSEYLRKVRSGRSITVLDRDTPIARIRPMRRKALR